jgi:Uma2 family endonuclease
LNETGKYIGLQPFTEDDFITPSMFPELSINLKDVFEDK